MSSSHLQPVFTLFLIFTAISSLLFFAPTRCQDRPDPNPTPTPTPTPTPWPHQFHATLFMNNSGSLQIVDLWYDWPNGRNLNLIRDQISPSLLYDLEWDNGTSYYYTLPGGGGGGGSCRTIHFEVGILRPNWLDGANYLGRRHVDGFLCDGWEKVDFIWYYEDVATRRPVFWAFFNGMTANVMTYEVGAMLEDAKWQAPAYCFVEEGGEDAAELAAASGVPGGWTQSPAAFNEPMNVSERGLGRVTKVASCHAERERERESGCVSIDVSPSRCRRHRTLPQGARWTMLRALILKDCCYGRR